MDYINKTFTTTVFAKTNDRFVGCTFSGGTTTDEGILMIGSCSNILVDTCSFINVARCGIVVRSSGSGVSNVTISNSRFENIPSQGIISKNNLNSGAINNTGIVIQKNTFINCGQTTDGKTHAIYAFSPNIIIDGNTINVTKGNGVSIRSSGTVINNKISNTGKSCVRYFNDQPSPTGGILYVENNALSLSALGYPIVSLLDGGNTSMISKCYVRYNTISGNNDMSWFKVESPVLDLIEISVYDNTLLSGLSADLKYVDIIKNPNVQQTVSFNLEIGDGIIYTKQVIPIVLTKK